MGAITRRQFTGEAALAAAAGWGAAQGAAASTERKTVARVAPYKGVPWIFINDAPHVPHLYFFPVPVKEHIADFAAAGIHIYSWGWGKGAGHGINMGWIGPGRYDYGEFDAEVNTILEANPQAYLMPRLTVSAPAWWLESHPDDRVMFEDGTSANARSAGRRYWTAMASKLWRRDATDAMLKLIEHVEAMPFAGRFIAYQPAAGSWGEWMYIGENNGLFPDFSPAAVQAFRDWLRARYAGDVQALRDAWKTRNFDFENASVPAGEERLRTDVNLLRDPAVSRRVSDYYQFYSEAAADALIHFCVAGKKATHNEKIFGAFYGYQVNATGGGQGAWRWGHQALRKVLESPAVDFLCAPYQYTNRGAGGYDGPQAVEATVKLHGKLFITECDGRLFTTDLRVATAIQGVRPTPAESFAVLKRDLSHRLATREGLWWMDLIPHGGWYHHPDIARFLARARSLFDKSAQIDMLYQGEIAVILDEETPFYLRPGQELLYPLVFLQDLAGLSRIGTPFDMYFHNDLSRPDMPEYKLYIFLNTLYLTTSERQAINDRIRRNNKVAVWVYGPGVISEKGLSRDSMLDLTGIHLSYQAFGPSDRQMYSRVYLTDYGHPITRACDSGTYFGSDSPIAPVFYAEDADARVLGRLLPSHLPGFVIKEFGNWKSIFTAAVNVPAHMLRAIAAFAGCHIYSDSNDIVYANSHFVAIHTDKGGPKRIRLPKRCDVYDAFTEALVAKGVTEFEDTLGNRTTRLYFLGDLSQIQDRETRFEL